MVVLYTGTPGSGKSFHLIAVILRNLKMGKMVISNFPIKFTKKEEAKGYTERFYYMEDNQITVKTLKAFALQTGMIAKRKESQTMVIIDEAGGKFNCRDYQNSDRQNWCNFFTQHRKYGYDFILVTQSDRMIDRQIRNCVEIEKTHRKVNNFSIFCLLPIPLFVAVERWYADNKERIGSQWFFYNKKLADRYDSMRMFEGFHVDKEFLAQIEQARSGNVIEPLTEGGI